MTREEFLIEQITKASNDYYTTGSSFLSDKEFDTLVDELESINPKAEILNKIEIHQNDWNYKLENLPYKLYSIKKVKTWKEIQNWLIFIQNKIQSFEDFDIVLTLKYDGIKLVHYNGNFYTRYEDGERGYNVTNRIKNSVVVNDSENYEGELIISKSNFKKYCYNYSSSRNFIPAIFSSKNRLKEQNKVEYIKYSIYGGKSNLDKVQELMLCNNINEVKVPYLILKASELTEEKIIKFYFENIGDFECDGVVLDINDRILRKNLGETQKYLDCCRAYKGDALFDDFKDSVIEGISWQMSRYGKLTPVAKIIPVMINQGLVSNISLYNAAYIKEENVYMGQKVRVTRRGKINPKIINFLSKGIYFLPKFCPFCGCELQWNDSKIDLICVNDNCIEKKTQQNYYFFKTIGIQNFGLESVKAYTYKGFNLIDFFNKEKFLNTNIEGIGDITKCDFLNQLDKIKKEGVELEKIQEASGIFQGLGPSTLKILNTLNLDLQYLDTDSYYNEKFKEALNLEGIGELSAKDYFLDIYDFYDFYHNIIEFIPIKNNQNNNKSTKLNNYNIVFTGFRNEEWKNKIEQEGGKLLSSISSNCNLLVVKDINSTSSKIKKAKELNIKIISLKEFSNLLYNL